MAQQQHNEQYGGPSDGSWVGAATADTRILAQQAEVEVVSRLKQHAVSNWTTQKNKILIFLINIMDPFFDEDYYL